VVAPSAASGEDSGLIAAMVLMSAETLQSLFSLALGFALAGLLTSGYQLIVHRPLSFGMMRQQSRATAVASVPFLVFAAPFVIMRNTIRGRRIQRRRVEFVALATILAGFWSLMSGTVVIMGLQALGILVG
jgi:hypothetical protein